MTISAERVQGKGFEAKVVRTDRKKTATVKVEEGQVSVVVPRETDEQRISDLLKDKNRWIKEKISLHKQYSPSKTKEYISGECFTYLGRNYRLKVISGQKWSVKLVAGRLVVTAPSASPDASRVKGAVSGWYRDRALERLREKVKRYAPIVGVKPKSVSVKEMKARWGSCSKDGDLLFNWKIIASPNAIVDYVVVHEMCHMKHHDHSPVFWKSVEKVIPDYLERKEWLKANGWQGD